MKRLPVLGLFFLLAAVPVASLRAAERVAAGPQPPEQAVQGLASEDFRVRERARLDLLELGPRALPALTSLLAGDLPLDQRVLAEDTLDELVRTQVSVVAAELRRRLEARREAAEQPPEGGADGQEDKEDQNAQDGEDAEDPPVHPLQVVELPGADEALSAGAWGATSLWRMAVFGTGEEGHVASMLLGALRDRFQAARSEDPAGVLASLRAADHLGAPLLVAAARAQEADQPLAGAAELLDAVLARHLQDLSSPTPEVRDYARRALFDFRDAALPVIRTARPDAAPDLAARLDALERRIVWGVDDALYARIGHAFEGYETMPWWRRRGVVHEVAALAEVTSIPALRSVLERDPSLAVRVVAAQHLASMGEATGRNFLQNLGVVVRDYDPAMNIPIFMSQGIKFLEAGRYQEAEAEFGKIVEIDPDHSVAHYNLACTYALWGKTENALEHLRAAIENGFTDFDHIDRDPDLDSLREDPQFKALMDEMRARFGTAPGAGGGSGDADRPPAGK